MAAVAPRPRSKTFTSEPSKRRDSVTESESGPAEGGVTKEPAAAYISTRISPPPSPLPNYDNYKEQRLYNYVMTTPTQTRHARTQSIGTIPENGFFSGIFNGSPTQTTAPALKHTRSQSLAPQPAPTAGRKFSNFFGLGSDTSSNSGLAFSSSSSSKRSVSNSTTMSQLVLPGNTENRGLMTQDHFAGFDFAELLNVPVSPLNCTPQGFSGLRDQSLELIDRLYSAYLERTRALSDAFAEIEALRDDLERKDLKIEGLRFTVDQLANVQETLSKVAEDAEKSAEKANQEAKKLKEENEKLHWETRSLRDDDASSIRSVKHYGVRAKTVPAPSVHTRKKSSANSDSGFESDTDSGSIFSHDYSSIRSKSTDACSPGTTYPQFVVTSDESVYEFDAATPAYTPGPLQQLRNALKRSTSSDGNCDCKVVINRLKSENGNLIVRVQELEGCLDNCLDLVGGI